MHINEALCHAVSDLDDGQDKLRALHFACAGTPRDCQRRTCGSGPICIEWRLRAAGVTLERRVSRRMSPCGNSEGTGTPGR